MNRSLLAAKDHRYALLLLALAKVIWFVVFCTFHRQPYTEGVWGHDGLDSRSYITPIENKLLYDRFTFDLSYEPAAYGRLPGPALVFGAIRLVLPQADSINAFMVLATALSTVSMYCVCQLVLTISKSLFAFWATVILFAVSGNIHVWDTHMLPESMAMSFLGLSLYFSVGGGRKQALISGTFMALAIFFKPLALPLALLLFIAYMFRHGQWISSPKGIALGLIFIFPLCLCLGVWTTRNIIYYHVFSPFQTPEAGYKSLDSSRPTIHLYRYVSSWGGELDYWQNRDAEIKWFLLDHSSNDLPDNFNRLLVNEQTKSQLVQVKGYITKCLDSEKLTSSSIDCAACENAVAKLKQLSAEYKMARPFDYYLVSKLRLLYKFLSKNPTFYYPENRNPLYQSFRLINIVVYLCLITVAAFEIMNRSLNIKRINNQSLMLVVWITYFALSPPIVFGFTEPRYLVPVYFFSVPLLIVMTHSFIKSLKFIRPRLIL